MPMLELVVLLVELLEIVLFETSNKENKEQEIIKKLQIDLQSIQEKDSQLRSVYEKEIDLINKKRYAIEDQLNLEITNLQEELAIIKNINSKFTNIKTSNQEISLDDMQRILIENSKNITYLKDSNFKLENQNKALTSDLNSIKIQQMVLENSKKDQNGLIDILKKENTDLQVLNKQIMKHKSDKTNPQLIKLAECLGVVTQSDKYTLENLEFKNQVKWIVARFKRFVSEIYLAIESKEVNTLKVVQMQLKFLVEKWGLDKVEFRI